MSFQTLGQGLGDVSEEEVLDSNPLTQGQRSPAREDSDAPDDGHDEMTEEEGYTIFRKRDRHRRTKSPSPSFSQDGQRFEATQATATPPPIGNDG